MCGPPLGPGKLEKTTSSSRKIGKSQPQALDFGLSAPISASNYEFSSKIPSKQRSHATYVGAENLEKAQIQGPRPSRPPQAAPPPRRGALGGWGPGARAERGGRGNTARKYKIKATAQHEEIFYPPTGGN